MWWRRLDREMAWRRPVEDDMVEEEEQRMRTGGVGHREVRADIVAAVRAGTKAERPRSDWGSAGIGARVFTVGSLFI
jgi:hypothetical protein